MDQSRWRMGRAANEGGIITGPRFIIYAARAGARSFFEGISDPTFFMTINKILDDGYYKQYEDPKHGEVFTFESLHDFVVHCEGLTFPTGCRS